MAEGFARVYGFDVVAAASAGVSPAGKIDPTAVRVMEEIGIAIADGFPKHYQAMARMEFDLVVNMSGRTLPQLPADAPLARAPRVEWEVADPVGRAEDEYRRARDLIQRLTLPLVDELRRSAAAAPPIAPPVAAPAEPSRPLLDHRRRFRRK